MARDYAKKGRRGSGRGGGKKGAPGWLWLLAGLTVGLFVAFLVYLSQQEAHPSTQTVEERRTETNETKKKPAEKKTTAKREAPEKKQTSRTSPPREKAATATAKSSGAGAVSAKSETKSRTAPKAQDKQGQAGSGAVKEAAAKKPMSYDFYKMLPEFEVEVPEEKGDKTKPVATPGNYILQVGSFHNNKEADSRKAELALLGIVATVQVVAVDGKAVWHRVRVGPYNDLERLNQVRRTLRENHIEFVTMKERS